MGYHELYAELRKNADERDDYLHQMSDALAELEMRDDVHELIWGLNEPPAPKWYRDNASNPGSGDFSSGRHE